MELNWKYIPILPYFIKELKNRSSLIMRPSLHKTWSNTENTGNTGTVPFFLNAENTNTEILKNMDWYWIPGIQKSNIFGIRRSVFVFAVFRYGHSILYRIWIWTTSVFIHRRIHYWFYLCSVAQLNILNSAVYLRFPNKQANLRIHASCISVILGRSIFTGKWGREIGDGFMTFSSMYSNGPQLFFDNEVTRS